MANGAPSCFGSLDSAGDPLAIFLKLYAGETLAAFWSATKAMNRHIVRSISGGKSAQFPASAKGTAAYHTVGTELVGTAIAHNERIITLDDMLVADRFLAEIDEAMSQYDVRSLYSTDTGRVLAQSFDQHVLQVMILAARAAATVTGGDAGTVITSANSKVDADTLIAAAFDAAQAMAEKNVPENDRYLFVKPDQYYLLVNSSSKLIHRDYGNDGNGSIAGGNVSRVAGFEIVMTNNLPTTNITTGPTAYRGNFSTTSAVAVQKSAVGTVKLIDLSTRADYDPRRLGTLVVSKMAVGHGVLRPECSVEIKTA